MARLQSIDERTIDWPRVEAAMTRRAGQAIEVGVVAVNDATVHRGSKELQEVFAR